MQSCRTCGSERLYTFLALGAHPLANGFLTDEQLDRPEPTFPLNVNACLDCALIQVDDNIPAEFFRHYVYVPSASPEMHRHFTSFAERVAARFAPDGGGLTVDIGCNDGLFLNALRERGAGTLGIDPATNIVELAREGGVEVVNEYFRPQLARKLRSERGPADVVVTTNTYHHIGDLASFTEGVVALLADDGVFIVEVPYAPEIVALNQFDGVYHEHVSQFTIKAFVDHFRRFDLEVFEIEHLPVHGGSVRVSARKCAAGAQAPPPIAAWIEHERERGLFEPATYDAFRERVEGNRDALLALLRRLTDGGSRIAGYGASARGNTLLNYCGIGTDYLDFIADRNELKHGLYSPGMHVPVRSPEAILEQRPDYLLLIAWNFADEIIGQQQEFARAGGRFIVPVPEPAVLNGSAA